MLWYGTFASRSTVDTSPSPVRVIDNYWSNIDLLLLVQIEREMRIGPETELEELKTDSFFGYRIRAPCQTCRFRLRVSVIS
jgi:hypothetical protein